MKQIISQKYQYLAIRTESSTFAIAQQKKGISNMNRKRIIIGFIAIFLLLCIPMAMQGKKSYTPFLLNDDDTPTEIRGYVEDSLTHNRLANVSITLLRNGKPLKFTRTKEDGTFVLPITEKQANDRLQATFMGYKKTKMAISSDKETIISMASTAFVLKEVQVKGSRITGRDTISFDLTRFANERDNSLKDVLKKLPGVDIEKNGRINYNGKPINRFTVEGLDLTGGKYNQLEENIKAKDVKKAEVIEHDQPIKALQNKTFTDNVAMNIALKDSARDKFMPTIKPYVLVGKPTTVGGNLNIMQIGKKKQMMYDATYDRSGKNLGNDFDLLASYSGRLSAATLPSWLSTPSLDAPIDEERLRFNTSQKYSINHIKKNKQDAESRIEANYVRQVIRQQRENTSIYDLGGDAPISTTERNHKTMISDAFNLEYENKVNQASHYGNEHLSLNAAQNDGLSNINDTLTQRIRIPRINIATNIYRLFVWKKSQLSWKSVADYHHGVADLYVNDDRNRIRTNLWHTAHALAWQKNRFHWTQEYRASLDINNLYAKSQESNYGKNPGNTDEIGKNSESIDRNSDEIGQNCLNITGKFTPFWQYKTDDFRISFSPDMVWERFTHPQKTLFAVSPYLYLYKKLDFRRELTAYMGYNTSTGSAAYYALNQYRKSYRSWYQSSDIIPITRSLYGKLSYDYKRPIKEIFLSVSVNGGRYWMNTATDLRIVDSNYYTSLYKQDSKSDNIGGSLYISKGFYDLHLKTRLTAEYAYSKGEQYTNHQAISYESNNYTLKPSIDFSPSWCQFSYEGEFSFYNSKRQKISNSSLFDWKQSLSATATISHVDLTFSLVHYHNELQEGNKLNCLLGDASAVWRMKKLRLSAELRNIFNKKSYVETTYSGVSTLTDSYYLRPRELMLTAQYSF